MLDNTGFFDIKELGDGRERRKEKMMEIKFENEMDQKILKSMWVYLNQHFGYSFPFPKIQAYIVPSEEWLKMVRSVKSNRHNIKEISRYGLEINKEQNEADGTIIRKEDNPWLDNDMILVADAETPLKEPFQRDCLLKFSVQTYYNYVAFHEMIHELEHATGRHDLYQSEEENLSLFLKWSGLDGDLVHKKTGRNDPCPCGSGFKYKKCCLNKSHSSNRNRQTSIAGSRF